jgi:hypothetical protein
MGDLVIENIKEKIGGKNTDIVIDIDINNKIVLKDNMEEMIIEMKKKKIIESIRGLNLFEHQEIFKIIKKQKIKFSENSNGIFINMNKLKNKTIIEIDRFISYCNSNKTKFHNENQVRNNLKKFVENRISQEKKEEHLCVNPNNKLEEKIEKGISYEEDNDDDDNLDDIEYIYYSKEELTNKNFVVNNNLDKSIMNDLKII